MIILRRVVLSIVLASSLLHAYSQDSTATDKTAEENRIDSVIALGKTFLGKPYRYQGPSAWPMDCSGFLAYIYSQYGYEIPRTSRMIANAVDTVDYSEVRKGDLLFFTGRNKSERIVGHVGMVISIEDGEVEMMHSARRGIIIDAYPRMKYYRQRFLKAGRLPPPQAKVIEIAPDSMPISPADTVDSISIIGVGDMMLGTNYPSNKYLPPNDGKNILDSVRALLLDANVTFGNLEGVILTGKGTVKECADTNNCYAFKMPDHYAKYFKEAGFDVLSLSNNHVNDFGATGILNTMRRLTEQKIEYAGLLTHPFDTFRLDSVLYGFAAFSPNRRTVRIEDLEKAASIVHKLDSLCDIVIVSFHGGGEGSGHTHLTKKTEMYLGEDRGNPYLFARTVIDAGADVVFGHGPHVTRAIDLYKDRFIAYSLGNFATYARFNLKGVNGLAPLIKVSVDQNGKFQEAQIHSIKQKGEGGPNIDPDQGALKQIIALTKADLPDCELLIDENGRVTKKKEAKEEEKE